MVIRQRASISDVAGIPEELQNLVMRVIDIGAGRIEQQIGDRASEDHGGTQGKQAPALAHIRFPFARSVRRQMPKQRQQQHDSGSGGQSESRPRQRRGQKRLTIFENHAVRIDGVIRIAQDPKDGKQRAQQGGSGAVPARRANHPHADEEQPAGNQRRRPRKDRAKVRAHPGGADTRSDARGGDGA